MATASTTTEEDVQALVRAIHEDRVAAKDKERRDSWTKYVSLTIVVFAVATAIGTLRSGGFSSKVLLSQSRASDTWAFYQAKSIKRHLAEMEQRNGPAEAKAAATAEIARYRQEEDQIRKQAETFEAARDEAAKHGPLLGTGIASLQISIALASVSLITKRKLLWGASAAFGLAGTTYLVCGLFFT